MEVNFLDELLQEAELREEEQTESFFDLCLLQIKQLTKQIEYNFSEVEKECSMINNFVLHKNTQLQDKIKLLELKLEGFIKERNEKTISLPNGTLKMWKRQDRIEIEDLELFMRHSKPEMLTEVPAYFKPNINFIKNHIKTKPVPPGIKIIEGRTEFSYTLSKGELENEREKETRTGNWETDYTTVAI